MDFPFFEFDFYGNRLLIAVVAILHVMINHPLAIGGALLVARMEAKGIKTGDTRWDDLARRILFFCFIITTTVGALTGVGIWLATALVNPDAIGSLLRVFFWAWFIEWLVFITEVGLILGYMLTWKTWVGERKAKHLQLGYGLAAFSFITMALIVAILGFMMTPGSWQQSRSLLDGILNPLYLPQLAFRTCLAMVMGGALGLALVRWFTEKGEFRDQAVRYCCSFMIHWAIPLWFAGAWYLGTVPREMIDRAPTALGTMRGEEYYTLILTVMGVLTGLGAWISFAGYLWPRTLPRWAYYAPFVALLVLLAAFERTREFVRKPYIIGGYMYANGIRVEDYPLYQAEGLLKHHAYATVRDITDANRVAAGHEVYRIACAGCHTAHPGGVNSVHFKFRTLMGEGAWNPAAVDQVVAGMHTSRAYMPPFPGTAPERRALAEWIVHQHDLVRLSSTPVAKAP